LNPRHRVACERWQIPERCFAYRLQVRAIAPAELFRGSHLVGWREFLFATVKAWFYYHHRGVPAERVDGDDKASPTMARDSSDFIFLIMGYLLGLGGLLAGMYLWGHFGPPARDPDDTDAYLCGLLVGGVMAISGVIVLLWMSWPRAAPKASQSSGS
jgi:hypothetical protein